VPLPSPTTNWARVIVMRIDPVAAPASTGIQPSTAASTSIAEPNFIARFQMACSVNIAN